MTLPVFWSRVKRRVNVQATISIACSAVCTQWFISQSTTICHDILSESRRSRWLSARRSKIRAMFYELQSHLTSQRRSPSKVSANHQ